MLDIPLAQIAQSLIAAPGVSAALAIVIVLSLDLFLPIPSSLVHSVERCLVLLAAAYCHCSVCSRGMAGFELTRRYGNGFAQRLVGEEELHKMDRTFARYGIVAILLSRSVPVMMETLSVLAGLSTMSRSTFVCATSRRSSYMLTLHRCWSLFRQLQSLVPAFWLMGLCLPAAVGRAEVAQTSDSKCHL